MPPPPSQHQQDLKDSADRVTSRHSTPLSTRLHALDPLVRQVLGNISWAICYSEKETAKSCTFLPITLDETFAEVCEHLDSLCPSSENRLQPIFLESLQSPLSPHLKTLLHQFSLSSLLLLPLIDSEQGEFWGESYWGKPRHLGSWQPRELELLEMLRQQIVVIIREQKLGQTLQETQRKNSHIQEIYHRFVMTPSTEAFWSEILSIVGQSFQVEQVIFLPQGRDGNQPQEQEWRLNSQIPPWQVMVQPEELSVGETALAASVYPSRPCAIASIPLKSRENLLGRLILHSYHPERSFSLADIHFLEELGNHLGVLGLYRLFEQELSSLSDKNRLKGEFLSYMTHELRTPLTGILGFARMLDKELYGELNDKQKEYVKGIATSGEHLLSLVNDFLDFSKLETKGEELLLEPMVVEELCQATMAMVQSRANELELDLKLEIAETVDIFVADQRRIKQILLNLLSNALKFTEKGSVTLQVTKESASSMIFFSVRDTGIGIKPEDQSKLFEPFEQIKNTLQHKHKGTGLGLAIAKQLAKLHGGDLTCISEVGKGSCFQLMLPQRPMEERD